MIVTIISRRLNEPDLTIKDEKELAYYLLDMDQTVIEFIYEKTIGLWAKHNLGQSNSIIPKDLEDIINQIYGIYKTTFQEN